MSVVVVILLIAGLVFFSGAAVGILRFPDFYSRLHPAGKMDTLGAFFMLLGLALANLHHFTYLEILTSIKILLIVGFLFLAGPTATHAIVDAGLRAGQKHWQKDKTGGEGQ